MHILIAPNAFKHSLTADAAAMAISEGFMQSNLNCNCTCFPVGDGGDGTAALIIKRLGGFRTETLVHDALGRSVKTSLGFIDNGKTAVIEMADACGIRLLDDNELNPLIASSYGTGEQIKIALDNNVTKIIIGMGGSATIDGGAGILSALGVRFLDTNGNDLPGNPENIMRLAEIDVSGLDKRLAKCEMVVLCDVNNYLLGNSGAAAVFGPQKGADATDVIKLDRTLSIFAALIEKVTGKNISTIMYGGTAGGAAAGLYSVLNAKLVNGIDYFLQVTSFDRVLEKSDLVITGEGSIDEQTLQGKAPFGVASKAKERNIPVIGLAGKVPLVNSLHMHKYFDVLMAIGHKPLELNEAFSYTYENLKRTAFNLGNLLAFDRYFNS